MKRVPDEAENSASLTEEAAVTTGGPSGESGSGEAPQPAPKKKKKKKRKPVIIVLDLVIAALILTGAYLLLKPYYVAWQQDKVMNKLDNIVKSTDPALMSQGIWVDPNANAIEGEALENFGPTASEIYATRPSGEVPMETYEVPSWVQLIPLGQLQIDAIDLRLPLLVGAGVVPLRYGAGWYDKSDEIGKPGRATILGHTMYYNMRFFSRVPELKVGERVRIVTPQKILNYEITRTEIIHEQQLGDYLVDHDVPSEIMLVTCYNRPVWDERFLVFAKLLN